MLYYSYLLNATNLTNPSNISSLQAINERSAQHFNFNYCYNHCAAIVVAFTLSTQAAKKVHYYIPMYVYVCV